MASSDDFVALQHLSTSIIQICTDIQKLLSSLNAQESAATFSHEVAALATAVESVSNNTTSSSEAFILVHDCEFPLRQAEFALRTTGDVKAVGTYVEILRARTTPLVSLYRRSTSHQSPPPNRPLPKVPEKREGDESPTLPISLAGDSPPEQEKEDDGSDRTFRNHEMVTKWVSNLNMYDGPDDPPASNPPRRGTEVSTTATVGDRKSRFLQSEADVDAILLRQSHLQAIRAFEEERYAAAKDIAKSALELASKLDENLTLNPSETWKLEQILVESCLKQEQWDEVSELVGRMQEDDSLEEDAKLSMLHWMAEMYLGQRKLNEAESYGWQAWRKRAVLLGMSNPATLDSIRLTIKIKDAKGDAKSAVLEALLRENTPQVTPPERGWDRDRSDSAYTVTTPTTATQRTSSVPPMSLFSPTMTSLSSTSRRTGADYETESLTPVASHDWLMKHNFVLNSEGRLVDTDATALTLANEAQRGSLGGPWERRESSGKSKRESVLVEVFHEAAGRGDDKVILLLLGNPTDLTRNTEPLIPSVNVHSSQTKQTALHRAAAKNNISTALLLIDHGADVNDLGPEHGSPLHFAAARGNSSMVRLLLDSGADVNAQTKDFPYSPLRVAVSAGKDDTVRDLISHGANLEARDNEGWTPLIAAAKRGKTNVVKMLLDAGADPKAQDKDRWTALHSAAYSGFDAIAKILIDKGADPSVTHISGDLMSKKTAWDIARSRKHVHMRQLLEPPTPGFLQALGSVVGRKKKDKGTGFSKRSSSNLHDSMYSRS